MKVNTCSSLFLTVYYMDFSAWHPRRPFNVFDEILFIEYQIIATKDVDDIVLSHIYNNKKSTIFRTQSCKGEGDCRNLFVKFVKTHVQGTVTSAWDGKRNARLTMFP